MGSPLGPTKQIGKIVKSWPKSVAQLGKKTMQWNDDSQQNEILVDKPVDFTLPPDIKHLFMRVFHGVVSHRQYVIKNAEDSYPFKVHSLAGGTEYYFGDGGHAVAKIPCMGVTTVQIKFDVFSTHFKNVHGKKDEFKLWSLEMEAEAVGGQKYTKAIPIQVFAKLNKPEDPGRLKKAKKMKVDKEEQTRMEKVWEGINRFKQDGRKRIGRFDIDGQKIKIIKVDKEDVSEGEIYETL